MKKIFIIISLFLITQIACNAIEEVLLEEKESFLEKYSNVYFGKIENEKDISPAIKIFTQKGLEFEDSFINRLKLSLLYSGELNYSIIERKSKTSTYNFSTLEPGITLGFNKDKSKFVFTYNILRDIDKYENRLTSKISLFYLSHDINKNQRIILGQEFRLPISIDSAQATMQRDMVSKTQLGRKFGDILSVGIRNRGTYEFVDYDIGLYDSTRFMREFGKGLDFTGHVMIKPLARVSEKTGSLKIGSGYAIGKNDISYQTISLYTAYDHKKFHINTEYAHADGYNGVYTSKDNAWGIYSTIAYDITPKLQVLARYDFFNPNEQKSNSYTNEYSAGITYKLFENVKFMLNYLNRDSSNNNNKSHIILFATRFFI